MVSKRHLYPWIPSKILNISYHYLPLRPYVSFLLLSGTVWRLLSMENNDVLDSDEYINSPCRIHSYSEVCFTLLANIFLTILQLHWGSKIVGKFLAIFTSRRKSSEFKNTGIDKVEQCIHLKNTFQPSRQNFPDLIKRKAVPTCGSLHGESMK